MHQPTLTSSPHVPPFRVASAPLAPPWEWASAGQGLVGYYNALVIRLTIVAVAIVVTLSAGLTGSSVLVDLVLLATPFLVFATQIKSFFGLAGFADQPRSSRGYASARTAMMLALLVLIADGYALASRYFLVESGLGSAETMMGALAVSGFAGVIGFLLLLRSMQVVCGALGFRQQQRKVAQVRNTALFAAVAVIVAVITHFTSPPAPVGAICLVVAVALAIAFVYRLLATLDAVANRLGLYALRLDS